MLTYHNDPKLKADMLREMAAHVEHNRLVKGTYGDRWADEMVVPFDFRGCAVGCAAVSLRSREKTTRIKPDDHEAVATHLGWPAWLVYSLDFIFERVSWERSQQWPVEALEAMPVGAEFGDSELRALVRHLLTRAKAGSQTTPEAAESLQVAISALSDEQWPTLGLHAVTAREQLVNSLAAELGLLLSRVEAWFAFKIASARFTTCFNAHSGLVDIFLTSLGCDNEEQATEVMADVTLDFLRTLKGSNG